MEKPQKIKSTRFARPNLDYSFVLCLSLNQKKKKKEEALFKFQECGRRLN